MNIEITLVDGGLHLTPFTDYLTKYLKYQHRTMELVKYQRKTVFTERLLYQTDGKGGLFTLQGFTKKIQNLIHQAGDTYTLRDCRTKIPEPDWEAIANVGVLPYQVDAVVTGIKAGQLHSGIFNAAGGYGKTYCQAFTYAAWNKLNTILAIPLNQVFRATYKKFCELFPDKHIGRVGDGFFDISTDITITTFKSLNKCAIEKCELLLVDELQGCTGESIQNTLSSFQPARIFGYTATDDGLFNHADKLLTGLFGERLIHIPYSEAEEVGAVVPGLVYFLRTPDVRVFAKDTVGAITQGIKRCKQRNELVAKVVAKVPEGWASLTFVDHISDHLIELHKLMPPGVKYVHRGASKKEFGVYAMTPKQQQAVIDEFMVNEFQHLIATDAFRAGVDIPQLRVVVQASGGSSKIEVIQEALRGSRTMKPQDKERLGLTEDKTHFVLIDFLDNHDERLERMAQARMGYYKEQGWKVKLVDSVDQIDWNDFKKETL